VGAGAWIFTRRRRSAATASPSVATLVSSGRPFELRNTPTPRLLDRVRGQRSPRGALVALENQLAGVRRPIEVDLGVPEQLTEEYGFDVTRRFASDLRTLYGR